MSVIIKRDEKAETILCKMQDINNPEEFINLFKVEYPTDYQRIVKTYNDEERKDKKGKGHPMPHPDVYLRNTYNVAIKKHKNNENI